MIRFRLLCMVCCFIVVGCTVRFYAPSNPLVAPPRNYGSISAAIGSPTLLEYKHSMSTRFDLMVNGLYYYHEKGHIFTAASGPGFWIFEKEGPPGFNLNIYTHATASFNQDSLYNWSLWGGRFGITPGYFGTEWNIAFPLSAGGGAAWNGSGGYGDVIIGFQLRRSVGKISSGLTMGIPVGGGDCYSNGEYIVLYPLPQFSFDMTYSFGFDW